MKKNEKAPLASPFVKGASCCAVEAIVTVDERGQMVLPKELREKAGIRAGEKLVVVSWEIDGRVCCISLLRTDGLTEVVKGLLGPMLKEMTEK